MATMQFRVSKDEFTKIVQALQKKFVICEILDIEDIIVDFLQEFMTDMGNEDILGFYNYELVLNGETIQLDSEESDRHLKELVKAAMIPDDSIGIHYP